VPDGSGGLWATGLDINPGGFSNLYHLANGHWTTVSPPEGVFSQAQENLTWIPGTRSLWGTAAGFTSKGNYGVLIKYGPLASSTAPERAQGAPCRLDRGAVCATREGGTCRRPRSERETQRAGDRVRGRGSGLGRGW
jgi:hypothetical protein